MLQLKTSITIDNMLLYKLEHSRIFALKPNHDSKTIFDLGITSNTPVSLEVKSDGPISFFIL